MKQLQLSPQYLTGNDNDADNNRLEFKACPFGCPAGEVQVRQLGMGVQGGYFVACLQCNSEGPKAASIAQAVDRWNCRR